MRRSPAFLAVSILSAAHFLAPAPLEAQGDVVSVQLDSAVVLMAQSGFSQDGQRHTGFLRNGGNQSISLNLKGGATYVILGVCDQDCNDMDLVLYDASGTVIGADQAPDDVPLVSAEPTSSGSFRLEVSIPSCSIEPCGFGVLVFVGAGEEVMAEAGRTRRGTGVTQPAFPAPLN